VRKLTLSLAVMAALLPVRGYSLGLGDLELNSALNQELNAEIEVLSAASADAEQILIKLADREAFARAGLDRPFLLQQLKFKIIDKNGKPFVKVYTKQPVREPFLSFLLEIDWPQGHLLREYTLLLDPPVYNSGDTSASPGVSPDSNSPFEEPADAQAQTQPVFSEQQSAQSAQSSVQAGVISSDTGRSVNYQYQPLPTATSSPDQYRVQQNDTLWSIANRMRPDSSVSVEQMMLALVRKNPEAFIQENMNGVKRGYILRMPDRDEATQIDRLQAVAEAREHAALWREYSQGVASAAPASSMENDAIGSGGAAEQVRDADGHLSIVSASESGSEHAGSNQDPDAQLSRLKQELAMANEQLESEKLEKEDLRSRLAELETRVQRVIEMDDSELAKLQQDLQTTQQVAEPADEAEESLPIDEVAADESFDAIADEAGMDDVISDEILDDAVSDEPTADELADTPSDDAIFVDETEAQADEGEMAQTQTLPASEPVETVEPPAFAQQKPKGFIESLLDNPKLTGIVGGGFALILLLVALLLKRIRGNNAEEEEQWTSGLGEEAETDFSDVSAKINEDLEDVTVVRDPVNPSQTAEMMADPMDETLSMGDTHVDAPDADGSLEDTVFNLDGGEAEPEEDDRDDVIAEADVYLAYGIYQQAEELLNTAIDQNPDRDDYRLKLLETHYAAKNASAFEQLAKDVKSRKGDDKSYWDRVIAMGMELCPGSELFSGANVAMADFDAEALLPDKPQTTDLELDAGEKAEGDFDLGLEDAELDSIELNDEDAATHTSTESLELPDGDLDLAGDLESITSDLDDGVLPEESVSDLEFDLGELDDMDDGDDAVDESAESTDMDIDDDFSLDFDAADLGFEESEQEAKDATLDADLDLGEDLEEAVEIDLSEDMGDALSDDLSDDLGGSEESLGDMDLGDMDLGDVDLDDMDLGDSAEVDDDDDSEFNISELSEDVDEVSTKLDLARAYIDMGDKDGARSILEEVKSEGNNEQQQQAEELIQQAG
jgi:pilus assembly protein FimV